MHKEHMRPPRDVWVDRHWENKLVVFSVEVVEVTLVGGLLPASHYCVNVPNAASDSTNIG
jgi:hypothetical protein